VSDSLQDAMLDAIMRASLRRSKEWPKRLVSAARRYRNVRREWEIQRAPSLHWEAYAKWQTDVAMSRAKFEKQIVRFADRLPEFLAKGACES
jgi:hypothetical protein